jgi:segregation and condensation protein A
VHHTSQNTESSFNKNTYQIQIPCFEGPLDLLLHLIRKDHLNIYDIPIATICKSYLEHLELMEQFDFSIAGEFVAMASALTFLKSQMLLPVEGETGEIEDPRQPLVAMLLEYETFKKAALAIDEMKWLGRENYARPAGALDSILPVESLLEAPVEQVEVFQLLKCLKTVLEKTTKPAMEITTDPVSIKEKVESIKTLLTQKELFDFIALLPENICSHDIIVSFLAVLELAKLKYIEIIQTLNFGPLQVRRTRSLADLNLGLLDQY